MRVFTSAEEIQAAKGENLGTSQWRTITQEQVDTFADATADHQWIHVDPERAAQGPFATTIAHGFLTLSMVTALNSEIYAFEGVKMGINYGLNRVRFPSPVKVGDRVRANTDLADVTETASGLQLTFSTTVEIEGSDKPGCVAEVLSRLVF